MSADFHVCATGNADGSYAFCGVVLPMSVCDFLLTSEAGLMSNSDWNCFVRPFNAALVSQSLTQYA
jgi:hypothetical protein